jgi:pilus assembly protein CpaE
MRRQFLTTVVDCGSTLDKQTLAALAAADTVIVVCTPELTTLRDLRECRRIFGQGLPLDKTRLMYVLNHPSPAVGLSRVKFEAALEQPLVVDIPYAGEPAARAALATGTFARSNAQSPFIRALDQLVVHLQPPETGRSDDRPGSAVRGASRFLRVLRGSSVMSGLLANHGG